MVASKLTILKMLREYFGTSKGFKELTVFIEKLYVAEKSGILASNEVEKDLFNGVLFLMKSGIFEGTYDSGTYDPYWEEIKPTSEADAWYVGLSEEHQRFVDELIDKRGCRPAFA